MQTDGFRAGVLVSFVPALLTLAGCGTSSRPLIAVSDTHPLEAELDHYDATILDDRWLLVPHRFDSKKHGFTMVDSAGHRFQMSAWSGGWNTTDRDDWLNLTVVDLVDGGQAEVFPRQVAIQEWTLSPWHPNPDGGQLNIIMPYAKTR